MILEDYANEVLRKIGRNMILFQKFEYLLKYIVANGNFSGPASEIEKLKKQQNKAISKQTMGALVGKYLENTNPDYVEEESEANESTEAFISFTFRIECDAIYYETKKETLARVVAERNELVHHLLPLFNPKSLESCKQLLDKLDRQHNKVKKEWLNLRSQATALNDGRKKLASFFASDEGKKEFELSFLRQSKLVILLGDIAVQTKRHDGWALMSIAGQLVRQHAPEEIALLKERYGHKSLKKLMLAAEIFDIHEEATRKGGVRVLYRLKPGWELSNA